MNRFKYIILTASLSALLGSISLSAQESKATAKINFAFHAGQSTLPAGDYSFAKATSNGVFQVMDRNTGHSLFVMANLEKSEVKTDPRLTFHCYADQCYLSNIWVKNVGSYGLQASSEKNASKKLSFEPRVITVHFQGR